MVPKDRLGSAASVSDCVRNDRFTLGSGAKADIRWLRLSANCDLRAPQQNVYSITSSASANSLSGNWRPSALAVVRLMTSRYLDACSTGSSAGLAPLRILSL